MQVPKLMRIVPCEHEPHTHCKTQGTKVLLPDGTPVPGITSITLHCDPNDIWHATIKANVSPPEVTVSATVSTERPLSWWRRVLLRLAGVQSVEDTDLQATALEFRKVRWFSLRRARA